MPTSPSSRSLAEERSELLRRAQAGSAEAWEELVDRFGGLVLSVARDLGLSDEDCQETFQNTWLAFFSQIDLLREPAALGRWLVITAQRQAWRVMRRRGPGEDSSSLDLPLEDLGPGPEEQALRLELRAMVREAIEELSARCKALLRRLYLRSDEPSYVQVAGELGVPVGSIGPTRVRCLAKLAVALERRDLPG